MKISHAQEKSQALKYLDSEGLTLNYQPIVNYMSKNVFALEALLSWPTLFKSDLKPEKLIKEVEKVPSLCTALDSFVVSTALRDLRKLQKNILYQGAISINVSPVTLSADNFYDHVKARLSGKRPGCQLIGQNDESREDGDSGALPPNKLIIEVTKLRPWKNPDRVNETIKKLSTLGVQIAVDSSITDSAHFDVLLNGDIDFVKVNQSVTEQVIYDRGTRIFFESFKGLSKHLNKRVIVEGIEQCEQAMFLYSEGYNLFQGHYFAPPADFEGIARYLSLNIANAVTDGAKKISKI